ncbi:hypothetical protein [Bacillus sp. 03113]|uniref:hypothetical protein n=1 Tax=Bacillus sp. 03113 TaxID=2578211 RepID=UPI0015E8CD52|nr:hypothetical protein [Bacillus sp. 03113]
MKHTKIEAAKPVSIFSLGAIRLGKSNKSKRFIKQGVDSVTRHDERLPYRMTYAEAETKKMANEKESFLGGI